MTLEQLARFIDRARRHAVKVGNVGRACVWARRERVVLSAIREGRW